MLRRKMIPIAIAICILLALTAGAVARDPDETERSKQLAVLRWTGRGVPGDDMLFDPQDSLNRGECAKLFSSLLGLRESANLAVYTDVRNQNVYAEAIGRCVAANIMSGVSPTAMAPENPVSREMFRVMLARALHLTDAAAPKTEDDWTSAADRALTERGCPTGDNPQEILTGREALYMLDQAVPGYTNSQGALLRAEGGVALAAAPEVIVSGTASDLVIAAGAEGGMLTLEDLTVDGEVIVCARVTLFLTGATSVAALRLTADAKDTQIIVDEGAHLGPIDATATEEPASEQEAWETPAEEPVEPKPESAPEQLLIEDISTDAAVESGGPPQKWPGSVPEERTAGRDADTGAERSGRNETALPDGEEDPDRAADRETAADEEPAGEQSGDGETGEIETEVSQAPARKDVPDWALDVRPAPAVDTDHPDQVPWEEYTVEAVPAQTGEPWDAVIQVHMRGLRPYRSGAAGAAFWTGFSLNAPEGATGYRVSYSPSGPDFDDPEAYLLNGTAFTRYFDASRWTEYYVRFAWTGEEGFRNPEPLIFKLDFSDVELDVSSLTTYDSLLGRIGPAPLEDLRAGAEHRDVLYESYTAVVESRKDSATGGYLEIQVEAMELREHLTAAGLGSWAGVSIAAPLGTTGCRYSVYLTLDAARKNFSSKPLILREDFSKNVDGRGTPGIRQLTNIAEEGQREYWMVVQWYCGDTGTVSLTTPVIYHVVLTPLTAGAPVKGGGPETTGENYGIMEDEYAVPQTELPE